MTITSSYLTEDLSQILRYFPGARPVTLDTPFDLTDRPAAIKMTHLDELQSDPAAIAASSTNDTKPALAACFVPLGTYRRLPWTTR